MASKAFLQQAYLAYFGRPADPSGLAYYAEKSEAQVKAAFSASPESQAFFGSMAVAAQINAIYQNLFNRDAETAGLTYWAQEIGSGRLSLADAAMGILAGAQNDDKTAVANKLAASDSFTTALNTTAEILGYAGAAAIAPARAYLKAVDATAATLTTAVAGVDASVTTVITAGSAVAGQTFTLTAGVDTPSNTSGNDTYNATGATLGAQDAIDGGAGTDKLVIVDTTKASEAGLAAATIKNVEALELNTNGGVGAFLKSGTAATAGTKAVNTITYTATTAATASVTIGGQTYTTSTLTADATGANAATAITALINKALGGTYAVASTGTVTITSPYEGAPLPSMTISGAGGTGSIAYTTANVDPVLATGAQKQVIRLAVGTETGHATDNTFEIFVGGVSIGTIAGIDTTSVAGKQSVATKIGDALNSYLGAGTATVIGSVVTVTAKEAGTALPFIGVASSGTTPLAIAKSEIVKSADAVVADTAATVYDASGFADAFTANGAGDMNVKAAATAAVNLTNTTGKVVVDGGKTVAVTTTGSGTTDVTGKALTTVSVKGGGVVTVDNLENSTAATTALGKTLTAVTLNGIAGATAAVKGAALDTVNLSTQRTALAVTVTNGTSTALNVNADAVGYTSTGADVTVSVAAGAAAKTLNLSAATKSQLTVSGAALEAMTVAGAGAAKINGLSSIALKSITSTNSAGVTLGALNAATRTLTTGDGKDSATMAATLTQTVNTGAGNDSLTLGSAVAAGSSINLGSGNDKLLNNGSGSIATGANSTTGAASIIDGGDGTDVIAASLLTVGTSALAKNFEVLGLDAGADFDTEVLAGATGLELLAAAGRTYSNVLLSQGLSVNGNIGTNATTLSFKTGQAAGAADSYSVTFGAEGAATDTAASPTSIDAGTLVVEGVETVNIVSGQAANYVNNTIDLTSATLKTVVLTGAATTTTLGFAGTNGTNASAGGGAVSLIDGSALSGAFVVDLTNITADNGAAGLTVKGGAGKDQITTAGKTVVVYGGAGADTFVVAANTGTAPTVTIADLASGDKIDMAGTIASAGTLGTKADVSSATSLAAALEIANGSSGSVATAQLSWFQYAGNTYIYSDLNSGSASGTLDANDNIVKITGLVDLTGSAYTTGAVITIA